MQTVSSQSARALDVPISSPKGVQAQLLHHFGHAHDAHILLVGKNEQHCILELILTEHLLELLPGDLHSLLIRGVHHIDEGLGVLIVVFPELPDLVLSSDVPHGELYLLELNGLHIESNGGHRGDDLAKLELVEDGGLACCVETQHQGAQLLLAEERVEKFGKTKSHFKLWNGIQLI